MITVKFEGGAQLAANLAALPTSVSKQVQRAVLVEAAEPMVAVMRRLAPRAPGAPDIADNIEIGNPSQRKDEFGDDKAMTVSVGPIKGFFYGYYQEWGTVYHGAQPFMRPAFDQNKDRSLWIIRTRTWEHVQSWVLSRSVL